MNLKRVKRAIISVSDKSNLETILPTLKKFKIEIISSGGSFKKIKSMKYNCVEVSNYTEFPEMLSGRVKTLHPKIHAGILNIRKNATHRRDLKKQNIPEIDLVIVDLYPFEKQLQKKLKKLIEYIDIGGSTLIRAAAKNFNDVTVISNIDDYFQLAKELKINKGSTSIKFRKYMSAKAFGVTAYYDSVVSSWLNNQLNIKFPEKKTVHGKLIERLRYGENPHQQGGLYKTTDNLGIEKIYGKELSYNNYNDIYSALSILSTFKKKEGTVIIKHTNPCGVSAEKNQIKFPEKKTVHGKLIERLRYGENPHQQGGLYKTTGNLGIEKIYGKELSYNNYNDIYSALSILSTFKKKEGTVIIKHTNPCGVSAEKNQIKSFKNALACDPISSFGGVVAINSIITKKLALEINKIFFEVIISRGFKKDAFKILKKRKNIRLINCNKFNLINKKHYLFLGNAFLSQDSNSMFLNNKLKIVTRKKPTTNQLNSLKFAFNICKFVKSNAIVLANGKSTIGIGAGQPSRLDSCKIASQKALQFVPEKITNSVAASDAFFPFSDGIEALAEVGIEAIIQPGGSINDKKVIEAANNAGLVMAFTGIRHFKH